MKPHRFLGEKQEWVRWTYWNFKIFEKIKNELGRHIEITDKVDINEKLNGNCENGTSSEIDEIENVWDA